MLENQMIRPMNWLFRSFVIGLGLAFFYGCATPATLSHRDAFPVFFAEKPSSILVVPAINESTAAEAADYFSATIAEPLANAGFYVYPIEITTALLQAQGIQDGYQLKKVPPQKLGELFGADAILYVSIYQWDTAYYVFGGHVTVSLAYELKSAKTGEHIWQYEDKRVIDTGGNSNNGGLLGAVIATAIRTASQDYFPIARQLNSEAVRVLPKGIYHPSSELHITPSDSNEMNKLNP